MPPSSKKKKKVPQNPARGFATISVASKPKTVFKIDTPESTSAPETDNISTASPVVISETPCTERSEPRDFRDLSPAELEKRLEEAELQGLVDKFSAKTRKEASRLAGKLQTECRFLRAQAEILHTRHLLPEELILQILDLLREEVNNGTAFSYDLHALNPSQEDEIVSKLWSLHHILLTLGFSRHRVEEVLTYVLRYPPSKEQGAQMWAFEECLDWFALNLAEDELPYFDTANGKFYDRRKPVIGSETITESLEPTTNVYQNGINTELESSEADKINSNPSDTPDVVVSDLESDISPEELLTTYLSTKLRLYEAAPELVDVKAKPIKARRVATQSTTATPAISPAIRKLQQKLRQIERDLLFDEDEANQRWIVARNVFAQQSALRHKLHLDSPVRDQSKPASSELEIARSSSVTSWTFAELSESFSEDDTGLSNLFDVGPVVEQSTNGNNSQPDQKQPLTVRDFGSDSKGISPRRVLEEACHARDSAAKLVYRLVSSAPFSNRHALSITWSKEQSFSSALQSDSVTFSLGSHSCSFAMQHIATPDAQQSEAFLSTFALFQLFSTSPKEEKVYLRLSPVWRDLWAEFVNQKDIQLEATDMAQVRSFLDITRRTVKQATKDGDNDDVVLTQNFRKRLIDGSSSGSAPLAAQNAGRQATGSPEQLKDFWTSKTASPAYKRMLLLRMNLPMFGYREAVLDAIKRHQVTIICGETGCGKSTQLPALILEQELSQGRGCLIYCTEPRRISAITLAQRVSEELGEHKNDIGTSRSLIGYAIRLESQISSSTKLVYATTGIVLRMLETPDGFEKVTHVIIDEVHERSIETDFLLIIIRALMLKRPELKVILMSATVDAQRFSSYFHGAPVLNVPGRIFPVETKFLEDAIELSNYVMDGAAQVYDDSDADAANNTVAPRSSIAINGDYQQYSSRTRATLATYNEYRIDYSLIIKLIEKIVVDSRFKSYRGAILVFLPGISEIRRLSDMLGGTPFAQTYQIHALHSSIDSEDQQKAFTLPPPGFGKIILSTNIAETGVTIPDVTCVIDSGKHKEMRFGESKQVSRLREVFISRANAKQRRGRAGRVQQGLCFHLFTRWAHDTLLPSQQTPEMLRLSLQDLVMRVKTCKLGDIQSTLANALDPPSEKNVRRAIDALIDVGALNKAEELTVLGHQLSKLPLDPYLGKLVLFGTIFNCLDISLTIAAMVTSKSPFLSLVGAREQSDRARLSFAKGNSDLLTEVNAYASWRRVCNTAHSGISESQFCKKNCLSPQTLANIEDIKAQLLNSLVEAGCVLLSSSDRATLNQTQNSHGRHRKFVHVPPDRDISSNNDELVSAVIAWSFYPKVFARNGNGGRNIVTGQWMSLHPTSIIRNVNLPHIKYFSFYSIFQSSGQGWLNPNYVTPISPLAFVLLAGNAVFHPTAHVVSIDGARLRFAVEGWKTFVALKFLRRRLEAVVERRWRKPGAALPDQLAKWMRLWSRIVEGWARRES